jgi:hypothetical protein
MSLPAARFADALRHDDLAHFADFWFAWRRQYGKLVMDFIETIFGIAPDGGSGMLEVLLLAIPIAASCYPTVRRWRRRRRQRARFMQAGHRNVDAVAGKGLGASIP